MRRHRTSGGVQTFSFLDAMVCTMGALLVLVHAFARHGQEQVIKSPEFKAARENLDAITAEIETLDWRAGQLKEARDKTQAQLDDERLRLSHVEDHQRRLLARLDELKVAAEAMDQRGADNDERAAAELEVLQTRLRESREALATERKAAQQGAVNYSVVPYEGPNATRRRPIYIECRRTAIVLQPEGVELTEDEFSGYLGPGNPLAAALRGMREYWARQTPGGAPKSEPYPLLLVRPEGIKAYYAARAALDSWGTDFGYELVGSDWQLSFPEPDAQLAQLTRQIVADAAVRSRALVDSLSQMAKHRPRAALHASPQGGFVAERSRYDGESHHGGSGRGADSITSNWGSDGDQPEGDGTGTSAGEETSGGYAMGGSSGGYANTERGTRGGLGDGSGSFGDDTNPPGDARGSSRYGQTPGGQLWGTPGGGPGGDSRAGQYDARDGAASGGQYAAKDGTLPRGQNGGGSGGTSQGASAARSSQSQSDLPAGQNGGSGSSSSSSSAASGSSGGDSAQSAAGMGMPNPTINVNKQQSKKTSSMAKTRGRDWGLPDGRGNAAATRPILIECYNDRLVILPDERGRPAKEVKLASHTQDSIDEFVADIWQHMKGWGMAGKGLYWQPTLMMEVKPGAADRYAEVKSLLADSGLDVHERTAQAAQPPATKHPKSILTR